MEDREIYQVLLQVRTRLRLLHSRGTEIPPTEIPAIYVDLFEISNLWAVELPSHGTVLYSKVGSEILIVDIL